MAKKNKTKVNLLRILLDDDQQIALDVYCMKRGVNKSEFCRRAIRQELDRVTSPTFVEEKIEIHIPVSATPRTYAERVAKRQSEELKKSRQTTGKRNKNPTCGGVNKLFFLKAICCQMINSVG